MAPTIPFWLGEAPGRSDELSQSVSRLRSDIAARLREAEDRARRSAIDWLAEQPGIGRPAAEQLGEYLATSHAALGCLPTQETIVFERFFDEAGGMQLVIHSPFRQPDQSRLGPGAAQALLPQVQFRTAGRGDRGQHRPVAHHRAQLRTRRRGTLPALGQRANHPDRGAARRADVRHPLALGCRHRLGAAAAARRQEVGPATGAHGGRGPDRRRVSRSARLRRKPGRRARDPRPSAGAADDHRLPDRGNGHRRPGAAAARAGRRRDSCRRMRSDPALAAGARGAGGETVRLSR